MSGSIGFVSAGMNAVYFDKVSVDAHMCTRPKELKIPPKPPKCSVFKEDYYGKITSNWRFIDPPDTDTAGEWVSENTFRILMIGYVIL